MTSESSTRTNRCPTEVQWDPARPQLPRSLRSGRKAPRTSEPPSTTSRSAVCDDVVMADMRAIAATITGRVQGVGYRYSVLGVARQLGLAGWVRNKPDGSVETWAQGHGPVLDTFVAFLDEGPRAARVDAVGLRSVTPDESLEGFTVRP